jgi:GGDEF domain-containing protein
VEAAVHAAAHGLDAREAVPVAARRSGPEQRWLSQLARSLLEHPHLAGRVSGEEFATLVPAQPGSELVAALIDAAGGSRVADVEEIAGRLGDEARSLLRSLAVDDGDAQEEEAAARTIDDTLRRLRREHAKRVSRAVTRKMREPSADALALVPEKEEVRRRAARDVVNHPPMGSSP